MATTTFNNWQTPDDTDLVKDGALSIRTLGSAIDTSVGEGLLAWKTYAPTLSGGWTNGNGTYLVARYALLGKLCFFAVDFNIGSTTVKGTTLTMSLPVATSTTTTLSNLRGVAVIGGTAFDLTWFGSTTTTISAAALNVGGTYATRAGITATVPGTWATNDNFRVQGFYQA